MGSRASHLGISFAFLVCLAACGGVQSSGDLRPETGEELSGGGTTVFINTDKSFSQSAADLTFNEKSEFGLGNSFFEQDWIIAPSSTTARDGLGPLFNARSCSACHTKDGRGRPPLEEGESAVSLLLRLSIPGTTFRGAPLPHTVYSGQLQTFANAGVDVEGEIRISREYIQSNFSDGEAYTLEKPSYEIINAGYGDLGSDLLISPRVGPQMIGMGLLEAIRETDILAAADENDENGDGISGKPNYVYDASLAQTALGRFGWKSNVATVAHQVAGAFVGDIGITSSLFPDHDCTSIQADCLAKPSGGDPEISDELLDAVVFYSKTLAVPARRNWDDQEVLRGKALFRSANCSACHVATYTTAADYSIPALAGQSIRPYTDLLLHDMGDGLSDGRPDFEANGSEWRTPPLWGVGLIEKVNGHTRFLHDGRARNLSEAILWHGGEAENSKNVFLAMSAAERQALIQFLESL